MSNDNKNMEMCLQLLLKLGRKNGGCITYKSIRETVTESFREISLDTIDKIHLALRSEQIEIVDELHAKNQAITPARLQKMVLEKWHSNHRQKNKRSKRNFSCQEQGIDNLLLHYEMNGELDERYFYRIVNKYNFSQLDVQELVEYLGLKGIDCPCDYDFLFPVKEKQYKEPLNSRN